MSTAGLPKFRKLWGRIDQDLAKGDYNVVIVNNYDVSSFQGQKFFVVSTTSFLEEKTSSLGSFLLLSGLLLCLAVGSYSLVFTLRKNDNKIWLVRVNKDYRQITKLNFINSI
jgi:Cell cycle control protein